MLCYVMLCYVMLCYVMLCYVMLCYVMLCYVMLCYVMLCYVMLCYVMLCYVMLCYVMLYNILLYSILFYSILFYSIVLYYIILYYIILYYIILYYILYIRDLEALFEILGAQAITEKFPKLSQASFSARCRPLGGMQGRIIPLYLVKLYFSFFQENIHTYPRLLKYSKNFDSAGFYFLIYTGLPNLIKFG